MDLTINKVAAGVVGLAMVAGLAFAFTATRAHAITLSELVELFIALEVIPEDKADEARAVLTGQDEEAAPSMSCNFTRNLTTGDTGADVMDLQKLLNGNGFAVSAAGAGSAGMETDYYGPATAGAVAAMQEMYAAEILTPLGLTAGTGYFGASTRAKANTLCGDDMPDTPDVPGDDDDEDMDDEDEELSGGEASLEDFDRMGSPSSVDVAENEEEVKVAGWDFEVEDADARLSRVDVRFEATAGNSNYSNEPWDYFEAVQLFVNGDMVAEENVDDEDDWDDETGNAWELRFSGLSEMMDEGSDPEIVVGVTTHSNLDGDEEATTWNAWIPANGIRARDGAGLDQYIGDADLLAGAAEERTFTTEGAGSDDELTVSLNSSNPDSSIIKVDLDDTTEDVTVLVFDMKAEGNDVEVKEIPVFFTIGTANFEDVITEVKLEVDGEEYNDYTATGTATTIATTTFDIDGNIDVDEDGKVAVKVMVSFNSLTGNYAEGETVMAQLRSNEVDGIDAEGGDDIVAADLKGSAIGETHQLYSEGIYAEIVSTDETKTAGDNNSDDVGDYEIEFDLTAFDDTFYVSATTSAVFSYHVEDGNGATVATTTTAAITSTATKEGDAYRIDEGDSEIFTLTVNLDPATSNFYRIELDTITYGDTAATPYGSLHTASPDEDFETGNLNLNA